MPTVDLLLVPGLGKLLCMKFVYYEIIANMI